MTKIPDGPLRRLGKAAEVGTDAGFKKLLAAEKKSPGHRAPARLRALLASFEVLRMSLGEAYSQEDGAPSRVWWFGEIGVAGEASATAGRLRSGFEAAGFKPGPRGDGKTAYARTSGGVTQEVVVEGPHRWVGGRKTACGFRLRWTVTDGKPAPVPPLAALLREIPVLRDARLEDSLYEALAETPTASLAVGGTWTRYYDWDASFSAEGPGGAARLHEALRALLAGLGYEASGTAEDGTASYQRPRTGSFAWLSPPDPKGRVRLRIQPES
ncbi:MAG: hypothetical protein HY927_02165 [Elusimicrobia bacterium]|nr:hypothetical protein [Elusimicrobiota bacterium]